MNNEGMPGKTDFKIFENCTLCPRECGADRTSKPAGYCRTGAGINIASICIHRGEEPPVSGKDGICNIFFSGCNLHCIYCQNHEISRSGKASSPRFPEIGAVLDCIEEILSTGIRSVGFVSPSHVVPVVRSIIEGLHSRNLRPVTVYNTNGYDKVETIRELADLIDVYLPDYKYISPETSYRYSGAHDYPEVALRAIKEMYFQKGSTLHTGDDGLAESGLMIRHLVLPGHIEESKMVLRSIAEEISTGVNLSLMSQYHPAVHLADHPDLNRTLYRKEYGEVVQVMEDLGFRNGWVQEIESNLNYRPDFSRDHPFE